MAGLMISLVVNDLDGTPLSHPLQWMTPLQSQSKMSQLWPLIPLLSLLKPEASA
jgi:hypothetical protein